MRTLSFARLVVAAFAALFLSATFYYALFLGGPLFPGGLWIALGALAVSIFKRDWALWLFLFFLPVFGNKPGSTQVLLLMLGASTILVSFRRARQPVGDNNRLMFFIGLYVMASVLSLTALPIRELVFDGWAYFPDHRLSTLLLNVLAFSTLRESSAAYSVLSVLNTLFAAGIALILYSDIREENSRVYRYAGAILAGLMFSVIAGLIDYSGGINLTHFRALDPTANPGRIQFRMQSFFGHSGWFAEYLTLSVPFAIILLRLPIRYPLRVLVVLLTLLVTEAALILTYQRGGWVSYPLTLFVVWGAIYATRMIERGEGELRRGLRSSFLKVVLSVPLTVFCTVLLLSYLSSGEWFGEAARTNAERYVSRFKDIQKTSDRLDFVKAGMQIGLLHPILGAGSESFHWAYEREFLSPRGHHYREINLPLHGSAHNVYLQVFSGKGAVGLCLLIALLLLLFWKSVVLVFYEPQCPERVKLFLLVSASFAVAFFVYGNVQEIFYVQSLQYLFFAVLGMSAAVVEPFCKITRDERRYWSMGVGCLLLLHLGWERMYFPGENFEYGCYAREVSDGGVTSQWCAPRARKSFAVKDVRGEKVVKFIVSTQVLRNYKTAPRFQASVGGETVLEKDVQELSSYPVRIVLSPSQQAMIHDRKIELDLALNSYFIPLRDYTASNDLRVLSFQIAGPKKKQVQKLT